MADTESGFGPAPDENNDGPGLWSVVAAEVSSAVDASGTGWPPRGLRPGKAGLLARRTQAVVFVGGNADGLHDDVQQEDFGQLPIDIECLGSVYLLAGHVNGQIPRYRFRRSAVHSELRAHHSVLADPVTVGRERAAELRDQAGRRRDVAAHSRDEAGARRDSDARGRDQRAEERRDSTRDWTGVATEVEESAAAADRDKSRMDRGLGAADRRQAELDRSTASDDREAAARDRRHASVDPLTGVYSRAAGLVELERDVARVSRTGHPLVLAFVDVDHLKTVNDIHGHAAGDHLLQAVASTLQEALRSYDLVIRYGGDEFLCVVQGIALANAGPRFARVNSLLARREVRGSVTAGLAAWQVGESADSLIARADADLYRQRLQRNDSGLPG